MGRAKQTEIPGTEIPVHPDIRKAAEAYRDARDTRQEETKNEVAKRTVLAEVMKKHGLREYRDTEADLLVTFETEEKVRVKSLQSGNGAPDDE